MSPKYPTLCFTARDVQDLLLELQKHTTGVSFDVKLKPTKLDPARLLVCARGCRRSFEIGTPPTVYAEKYVPGKAQASIDRAMFDVLWEMLQELEVPTALWGTYTELVPLPSRRKR